MDLPKYIIDLRLYNESAKSTIIHDGLPLFFSESVIIYNASDLP